MALSNNAIFRKVMVRKVLGFKCILMTLLTFIGTHLIAPWRMLFTPFTYLFFFFLLFLSHLWASIKLLDVNEVAIIMIILGELKNPSFWMIIASKLNI
jgi:hypothetical protein